MNDQQRDDMLTRIDERTQAMNKALFGNGQPGLVQDVAVLKDEMAVRRQKEAALETAVGSKDRKTLATSGILTAIMLAVLTAAQQVFGQPK